MMISFKNFRFSIIYVFIVIFLSSCSNNPKKENNNQITYGQIKKTLIPGKTTKSEVLQELGAPNIITYDSNKNETWAYQRAYQETTSQQNDNFFHFFVGFHNSNSNTKSSSKMITLLIVFEGNVVKSYKTKVSNF